MPFIRGFNPIWSEVDLSGRQFDDTFWLFVLQNQFPYLPAKVYQDPNGLIPWNNPIQFLANGTLPPDIYFDSGSAADPVIYRLEFRQGNSQADPLIYLVENYIPGNTGGGTPTTVGFSTDNQVTNPQFSVVNFNTSYTLTSNSSPITINVAPGWTIDLTTIGTGTITLTQVPLNSTQANPTNAPYALQIDLSGWATAVLKQRFDVNGMLWANKYVSSSVTARNNSGNEQISAFLVDSMGNTLGTVLENKFLTGTFNEYTGHALLGDTINTNLPPAAFIDYVMVLPVSGTVFLTSFQLVASDVDLEFEYEQDSIDRQIDQTFHYYSPQLKFKPIPSLLVGWDFALNPGQWGYSQTATASPIYVWDQTIMGTSGGNVTVNTVATNGGLIATTSANNQAFYLLQYLSGRQAFEVTLSDLASNIMAYQTVNTGVTCRVYLFYTNNAGSIPILGTTIGTIDTNGVFTLTPGNNWIPIPQIQGYSNTFSLNTFNVFGEYQVGGFQGTAIANATSNPNFAMVVTFKATTAGTGTVINSISLTPGDIATRPAPKTIDEVLRECQYYYETSGNFGAASLVNAYRMPMTVDVQIGPPVNVKSFAGSFTLNYKGVKRATPLLSVSSTAVGTSGNVTSNLFYNPAPGGTVVKNTIDYPLATYWNSTIGTKSANFNPIIITPLDAQTNNTGNTFASSDITFQYILDSRLGVV